MAYHWAETQNRNEFYADYLNGSLSRDEFYQQIPDKIIASVINAEIGADTLQEVFQKVDALLDKEKLDLIHLLC